MSALTRFSQNPVLKPDPEHVWEHDGAFNGCPVFKDGAFHLVYRALSQPRLQGNALTPFSSIGYAKSLDGFNFSDKRQLFTPSEDWEKYGCEDPRLTFFEGKYYLFYTALSQFPYAPSGIKLGMAVTPDFQTFEKHPVTPFNAKAMALFPERINGKIAALLTVNTDLPPAKIALALFDKERDLYSPDYWNSWYADLNSRLIHLLKSRNDQIEVGAPPLKTPQGWLLIYACIENYRVGNKKFRIEAALLDLQDPRKIIGRTSHPLLIPQENYEFLGNIPEVIFPTGAVIKDGKIFVYYGAADTVTAVAVGEIDGLLDRLMPDIRTLSPASNSRKFVRFEGNPVISPSADLDWQSRGVFNPAALYEAGKFHLLYRAQGQDGASVFGYAASSDGFNFSDFPPDPVYLPREDFEINPGRQGSFGCEDPRISGISDRYYVTYTAYDGASPPRVALTSIAVNDFLRKNWFWEEAKLISPPGVDDKDACLVKNLKGQGFLAFHRLGNGIWLDVLSGLESLETRFLSGKLLAGERKDNWDDMKIGIAAPPFPVGEGWVLIYHALCGPDFSYKVGALLLDFNDPYNILGRTDEPLLEPERKYELEGQVKNVVFPCGAVVKDGLIYLYYGGADTVICAATMPLKNLIDLLLNSKS